MNWGEVKFRQGRFYLFEKTIEDNLPFVQRIMSNVIVINCRANFSTRLLEYDAICHMFEEVEGGIIPPLYRFFFDEHNDLACQQADESSHDYSDFVSGDFAGRQAKIWLMGDMGEPIIG